MRKGKSSDSETSLKFGTPSNSGSAPKTLETLKHECIALEMECRRKEHELKMKCIVEELNIKMEISYLKILKLEKEITSLDLIINSNNNALPVHAEVPACSSETAYMPIHAPVPDLSTGSSFTEFLFQ